MKNNRERLPYLLRPWFGMTQRERMLVAGIGLILLIGATARCFYLKKQIPEAYDPVPLMQTADAPLSGIRGVDNE